MRLLNVIYSVSQECLKIISFDMWITSHFFPLMPFLLDFYFCGLWNKVLALLQLYFFCILSMSYHQSLPTFKFVFIFNTKVIGVKTAEKYLFFPINGGGGKVKTKTLFLITLVAAYVKNKIMKIIPVLLLKIYSLILLMT